MMAASKVRGQTGAVTGTFRQRDAVRTAARQRQEQSDAARQHRMPGNQAMLRRLEAPAISATKLQISRKCAACEDEDRKSGPVQAKAATGGLPVSEPSDPAEREADAIADRLFPSGGSAASGVTPAIGAASGLARRKAEGGGCASCGGRAQAAIGIGTGSGKPLPRGVRTEMESGFGADFSSVRVHTGPEAARVSRSLNARAFAFGNDIFFADGAFDPDTKSGKNLLAHELTHTIQQRAAGQQIARDGAGRTRLQCVNENLSAAGVASWALAIIGGACGLVGALAGSPTGPGAAGAAAFGAALCIAGVTGFGIGAVLGIIRGCSQDVNFQSRGAYLSSNESSTPAGAQQAQQQTATA